MRFYTIAISALAIEAPRKWIDNLLAQHTLDELPADRQGVARRVSHPALMRLSVIRQLHIELGIGVRDAVRFSEKLLDSGQARVLEVGQLRLVVDAGALRRNLDLRLSLALESAPTPRRGRPPRKPA